MFDDPNKSSLEDNLNGWWISSCAWTTQEITGDESKHGDACLHLVGYISSDCAGCIMSPEVAVETGKTYQGRFWIKAANGTNTTVGTKLITDSSVGTPVYVQLDSTWREIILEPYTVGPNDGGTLRLYACIGECTQDVPSEEIEVYIDCLQIEEVLGTNWELGGTPRRDENLCCVETLPAEWTNVFTFYPAGRKEYYDGLASGKKLYIKSWRAGDSYVELYFDPNASDANDDDAFVLFVTDDTNSYSVHTEAQHFQRLAQVKFAVVCYQDQSDGDKTKLKMHVANGGAVETPSFGTSVSFDAFGTGSVTACAGDKDGLNVFGGLVSHDDSLTEAVGDEDIKQLLDSAGTGLLAADLNGDCHINLQDLTILALHWLDANCTLAERCDDTDLDWSGEVDWLPD
jgi:hypothetical protein